MTDRSLGTALVTGASSGIGAIYAVRLAKRGHDLILVPRNETRRSFLSERLTNAMWRAVEVLPADLGSSAERAKGEAAPPGRGRAPHHLAALRQCRAGAAIRPTRSCA